MDRVAFASAKEVSPTSVWRTGTHNDRESGSPAAFKPVVGDIVNFFGLFLDAEIGLGPYAAIVTRLHGIPRVLGLTIFTAGQAPFYIDLVPSLDGRGETGPYWTELPL